MKQTLLEDKNRDKIGASFAESKLFHTEEEPPEETENNQIRLKTLYLIKAGTTLTKEYERFVIKKQGEIIKRIPAIHVDQIMVFGNSQLTTQVMQYCLEQRIPIYLLSGKGKFYGMVDSFNTEPVLIHKAQFIHSDNAKFCLKIASQFIKGKIANSQLILKRLARNRDATHLVEIAKHLERSINNVQQAKTLDQLRGYEGSAARQYFQGLAEIIPPQWGFKKRVKQPPTDPVNALLSYGYTLLFYNIYSFLRARGLNPHVGYLHPMRMGHPALASDMIEEFRAIIVDAVVFNLVLNNKLSPDDFEYNQQKEQNSNNQPACYIKPQARAIFIQHLETKLNASLTHPNSGLKLDYRRCIEHQVNHLAAVIRGNQTDYQAIVLR